MELMSSGVFVDCISKWSGRSVFSDLLNPVFSTLSSGVEVENDHFC